MRGPLASAASPALQLIDVDEVFERIAATAGRGSPADRVRMLRELLARATGDEQDFLMPAALWRAPARRARAVLLEAVRAPRMCQPRGPPGRHDGRRADCPSRGPCSSKGNRASPVSLCRSSGHPTDAGPDGVRHHEALADLEEDVALEWKLDGRALQVHKAGDEVKVFSRNLREVTAAVPEVVEAARRLPAREVIFDGEVIALRPDGTPGNLPADDAAVRPQAGRRSPQAELPLTPFFFDCLYVDGASLVDQPQAERFGTLTAIARSAIVPSLSRPTREDAARCVRTRFSAATKVSW